MLLKLHKEELMEEAMDLAEEVDMKKCCQYLEVSHKPSCSGCGCLMAMQWPAAWKKECSTCANY